MNPKPTIKRSATGAQRDIESRLITVTTSLGKNEYLTSPSQQTINSIQSSGDERRT